jgi:hypothetical protein
MIIFLGSIISCKNEKEILTVTPEYLTGDWLQKEYMLALFETKSPLHSYKQGSSGQEYIQFFREANIYKISVGHSFNYALTPEYDEINLDSDGFYSFSLNKNTTPLLRVKRILDDELIVTYPERDNFQQTMVRVTENLEQFINKTIIAGDYISDMGVTCSFSIDGKATLPNGKSILYKINLNPGWQKYDWIRDIENRSNVYVYKWDNDKLLFYDAYYSFETDSINPTGNPIILTKID